MTPLATRMAPLALGLVAATTAAACARPGAEAAPESTPRSRQASPAVGSERSGRAVATASATASAPAASTAEAGTVAPPAASPPADVAPSTGTVDTAAYGWHADPSIRPLPAVDRLVDRIASPAGFVRVPLAPGSFGAWLRTLPLAAVGTPVVSFDGRVLRPAGHAHVAAVATLDVGKADLQQCADAVIRLHAEWSWSRGKPDVAYQAAAGTALPFARWARGERVVLRGRSLVWEPSARRASDHAAFRGYLDAVFSWANTVSLARQAKTIGLEELRPGDFLILPGGPGHTVLVLDLAQAPDGRRAVLLGQSYMPAQSYHVLRPSEDEPWFAVDQQAGGIQTPFWLEPFPWTSLRRLD